MKFHEDRLDGCGGEGRAGEGWASAPADRGRISQDEEPQEGACMGSVETEGCRDSGAKALRRDWRCRASRVLLRGFEGQRTELSEMWWPL